MVSVGIVGSGFSGLCMAIQLRKAGFNDFTIFEAANDIGGTWQANTYPGCSCDIKSVLYCFSFEPYPWTQHYSGQPEILNYLHHCADKYNLWPHIRLNTRVAGAVFDQDTARWTVSTADGQQHTVQVLVLAVGGLSVPTTPNLPGLSGFKGTVMHTAAWDHSCDLAGKRVAVVGTAASGIQVIPQVQQLAQELIVFQRTQSWVLPRARQVPKYGPPVSFRPGGWLMWLQRQAVFWINELLLGRFLTTNNQKWLRKLEVMAIANMQSIVKDPELRQKLTPDYTLGCKRVLGSDDYYPALCQPNVRLVASGLKQVHADGTSLEAENGETVSGADVIIFATGFDLKAPLAQFHIEARGQSLLETMKAKPQGYYGMTIAGFPNFFTLLGVNSGLGHNSVVFMIERQVHLIMRVIRSYLQAKGQDWVEVTAAAQQRLNCEIQQRLKKTVWLSGCKSWYLTSSILGSSDYRGAIKEPVLDSTNDNSGGFLLWPGLCAEFWWRTLWPVARDWVGGKSAAQPAAAVPPEQQRLVSAVAAAAADPCAAHGGQAANKKLL